VEKLPLDIAGLHVVYGIPVTVDPARNILSGNSKWHHNRYGNIYLFQQCIGDFRGKSGHNHPIACYSQYNLEKHLPHPDHPGQLNILF
jgi:hypothetical protein